MVNFDKFSTWYLILETSTSWNNPQIHLMNHCPPKVLKDFSFLFNFLMPSGHPKRNLLRLCEWHFLIGALCFRKYGMSAIKTEITIHKTWEFSIVVPSCTSRNLSYYSWYQNTADLSTFFSPQCWYHMYKPMDQWSLNLVPIARVLVDLSRIWVTCLMKNIVHQYLKIFVK